MRFVTFFKNRDAGFALKAGDERHGLTASDAGYPGALIKHEQNGSDGLTLASKQLRSSAPINPTDIDYLPQLGAPSKLTPLSMFAFAFHADAQIPDVISFIHSASQNRGSPVEGNRGTPLRRELRTGRGKASAA